MKRIAAAALVLVVVMLAARGLSQGREDQVLALKEKIIDLQNKGTLGFRNFTFCSKILGFASYVPLPAPVIDRSSELLVYFEPVDVFTNRNQGLYEIWFTEDMTLLDAQGQVMQEWKDIVTYHQSTRRPILDVYAQNSVDFRGEVRPGKYAFKTVLKDKLSGQTAVWTAPFEVR